MFAFCFGTFCDCVCFITGFMVTSGPPVVLQNEGQQSADFFNFLKN